jgi:hypothetical protein
MDRYEFQNGNFKATPAVFIREASKELRGYGTWKRVRKMG